MASFYGNMKNNSRASFIFDRVYPSRVAMETMLHRKNDENVSIGDGIFIILFVLVDYHYALLDDITDKEKVLIDVKSLYRMDELNASGMRFWRM